MSSTHTSRPAGKMFQILSTFFKIPEIHIPVVRFPSAKDLQEAGAKGQTSTRSSLSLFSPGLTPKNIHLNKVI